MSFYNKVEEFISKEQSALTGLYSFEKQYEKFIKEWKLDESRVNRCTSFIANAKNEIKYNESKLKRDTLKCVIFGRVSAGKSALINAILTKRILPSFDGPTTNSFVEIKKSLDGKNYVTFSSTPTERRAIECLSTVDAMSKAAIKDGSHVDLFYSAEECPLLSNNVVIVDTPGIDTGITMNDVIKTECEDADVLILLVASESGLGECEKNFISEYTNQFSRLNVLIVFNKWDVIHSKDESRCAQMEEKYRNVAEEYLREHLHVGVEDVANRIYFISAIERLSIIENDTGKLAKGFDQRNKMFEEFLSSLKVSLAETSAKRKISMMKINRDALCDTYKETMSNLINEKSDLSESMKEKLHHLHNFHKTVKDEAVSSFKASYQPFFLHCIDIVKRDVMVGEISVLDKLKYLIDETMVVTIESLKRNITDSLSVDDRGDKEYIIKILKELYFPFHFDITQKKMELKIDAFKEAILKIIKIKAIGTGLSIAGAAVGAAAILATGGVVAGILVPIDTAIAVTAVGSYGAVVGATSSGSISTIVKALKLNAFRPFFKESEAVIKSWWRPMKESLFQTYETFLSTFSTKIDYLTVQMDVEIENVGNIISTLHV